MKYAVSMTPATPATTDMPSVNESNQTPEQEQTARLRKCWTRAARYGSGAVLIALSALVLPACFADAPSVTGVDDGEATQGAEDTGTDAGATAATDADGPDGSSSSGSTGSAGRPCPAQTPQLCGELCVDIETDSLNCGDCQADCGSDQWACVAGECLDPRTWGMPGPVENNELAANFPTVGVADNDNAVVVWMQRELDDPAQNVWANHYDASRNTWTGALRIDDTPFATGAARVAVAANGDATAVWEQDNGGGQTELWANRYSGQVANWGTAQALDSPGLGDVQAPSLAIDAGGSTMVLWTHSDGAQLDIYARRYDADVGAWQAVVGIESDDTGDATSPTVALDGASNAIAVWQQSDGTRTNIWTNAYNVASDTWGTAIPLELDNEGDATTPRLAVNPTGTAVVAWSQRGLGQSDLWANRYDTMVGAWSGAQLIESAGGSAYSPHVGVDQAGSAIVVWEQDAGVQFNIFANRFDANSGVWGRAQAIEFGDGSAHSAVVIVDPAGHAVAAWSQDPQQSAVSDIWSNRYNAFEDSWDTAAMIEQDNAGGAESLALAGHPSGGAIAVWHQSDGDINSVMANFYR